MNFKLKIICAELFFFLPLRPMGSVIFFVRKNKNFQLFSSEDSTRSVHKPSSLSWLISFLHTLLLINSTASADEPSLKHCNHFSPYPQPLPGPDHHGLFSGLCNSLPTNFYASTLTTCAIQQAIVSLLRTQFPIQCFVMLEPGLYKSYFSLASWLPEAFQQGAIDRDWRKRAFLLPLGILWISCLHP